MRATAFLFGGSFLRRLPSGHKYYRAKKSEILKGMQWTGQAFPRFLAAE
jgi:hypothetical protein